MSQRQEQLAQERMDDAVSERRAAEAALALIAEGDTPERRAAEDRLRDAVDEWHKAANQRSL